MDSLARGFAEVDKTDDPHSFIKCLNLIHSLPFFQEWKSHSYQLLNLSPGDSVLEIGCGNGRDIYKIAELVGKNGTSIGVDISTFMLRSARNFNKTKPVNPDFILCDGQYLPFPESTFHAVRSERVLQHTHFPFSVVKEMARVTRPHGSVVTFEPDWGTLTLWPGDREICRKILNFWCDNIPSGHVGRSLYPAFSDAGLKNISVQPVTLTITDLALIKKMFDLETTFSLAIKQGIVSSDDIMHWENTLSEADKTGKVFSSLTFFLVKGEKSLFMLNPVSL